MPNISSDPLMTNLVGFWNFPNFGPLDSSASADSVLQDCWLLSHTNRFKADGGSAGTSPDGPLVAGNDDPFGLSAQEFRRALKKHEARILLE